MSRWSIRLRKTLLSLVRPHSEEASDISPRTTVAAIDRILTDFANKVKEEGDPSLKDLFTDLISEFRLRLDEHLEKIVQVEEKKQGKKRKRDKSDIKTMEDIQMALDRLADDIAFNEENYEKQSTKALHARTAIRMSSDAWLACLNTGGEMRAPEHEMKNYDFYTQGGGSFLNTSKMRKQTSDERAEHLIMQARWLSILAWATAEQRWRDERPVPFDPDTTYWKRGRYLGGGMSGQVSVAAILGDTPRKDQRAIRVLAVKQIRLGQSPPNRRSLLEDHCRSLFRAGKHSHVVSVVAYGNWKEEYRIFMEYVSGGSFRVMMYYLKFVTETEAVAMIRQIAHGLQHLHTLGFVHRDLKGSNVLITLAGCIKICDLDTARDPSRAEHGAQSSFGTPHWMAPESANGRFSARSDVWSLGCILVELITGRNPWELSNKVDPDEIKDKLRTMDIMDQVRGPPLPGPARLGTLGRSILQNLVFVRLESRIGVTALLNHPWIAEGSDDSESSTPSEAPEETDIDEVVGELEEESDDSSELG